MNPNKIPDDRNIISGIVSKNGKRYEVFLNAGELKKLLSDKLECIIGPGIIKPNDIILTDNFLIVEEKVYEPAFKLTRL